MYELLIGTTFDDLEWHLKVILAYIIIPTSNISEIYIRHVYRNWNWLLIWNYTTAFRWYHCRWPWRYFKVIRLSTSNFSLMVRDTAKVNKIWNFYILFSLDNPSHSPHADGIWIQSPYLTSLGPAPQRPSPDSVHTDLLALCKSLTYLLS